MFKNIGDYLRDARKQANVTQGELAEQLGYANAQFISNIERGLANLPLVQVTKAAKALGVPREELMAKVISTGLPEIKDPTIRLYCMNTGEVISLTKPEYEQFKQNLASESEVQDVHTGKP